ncbi:MAG: NlpC/P60 family protein [Verrucomicrobia bacterium]|nr:NlpC/P60 family protein [Verrucomicrobiota bacterium]
MRHRLLIILMLGALIGAFVIPLNPVRDGLHRIALLGSLAGVWLAPLLLGWRRKTFRYLWLAIPLVCAVPFALPGRPLNGNELRAKYLEGMTELVGTKYFWGGESSRGIDCSGLPRLALREALLAYGLHHLDGGALRLFVSQWWHDASAKALGSGYRGYTIPLGPNGTIKDMDYASLQPGDLAVTESGVHVLAYLGEDRWIQADPGIGAVAILNGRSDRNRWFEVPVTTHRWTVFRQ